MAKKLGRLTALQGKYNFRAKYYPSEDGGLVLAEEMVCSNFIFNPDGVELRGGYESGQNSRTTSETEKVQRSRARAKAKIFDLIMANSFRWFVTLTLSPDEIDRYDYAAVVRKLNYFLGNRVRRCGMVYVGVPELHKNGGLHFHFLVNDTLTLTHSGTYIRPTGGKPVKLATLKRYGVNVENCRDVYNVVDWRLGFSTAIELDGNKKAVAGYVGKYITKAEKKVGGRWYYSGGDLRRPVFTYDRIDFDTFEPDYTFECPLGEILVRRF
jgi:hypothetical protein